MKLGVFMDWRVPRQGTAYDFSSWTADLRLLQRCGVSAVVLGLSPVHLTRRRQEVSRATDEAHLRGIDTDLMIWAHRDPASIATRMPALRRLCDCTQSRPVLNAERPWRLGDRTPEDEAQSCANILYGTDWAVACLPRCSPATTPLARLAPRGIPEAYSVWEPDSSVIHRREHSAHPLQVKPIRTDAPPEFQRLAYQSWQDAGAQRLELGLGAYFLERPNMSAREVLTGQLEAARDLGCEQVWIWSMKWLRGRPWMIEALAEFSR